MEFDFIIVGQGLAGSLLAYELLKPGKKVLIIDEEKKITSSKIAAGIIHPVTGRRIVKTWKADILIPFAKSYYSGLESFFKEKLFYDLPILEIFSSAKNRNDWLSRSTERGYEKYIGEEIHPGKLKNCFDAEHGGIAIHQSGYLNIGNLLEAFKKYFQSKNVSYINEFSFEDIQIKSDHVEWKNIRAEKIIFCEGAGAVNNPFFRYLPFLPAKGEILEIYAEELLQDFIINQGMFILPAGNHHFKAGSTYQWDFKDAQPSSDGKKQIESFLKKFLKVPYQITDHSAAVRPTVQDRRPMIGLHPEHRTIGIFNGLGTKGVMLAPYYAKQFADFLNNKVELDKEVNIVKFT